MKRLLFTVVLVLVAAYWFGLSTYGEPEPVEVVPTTATVKYEVRGSAPFVSLTYVNASGGMAQETKVKLPWVASFTTDIGNIVTLSAQNEGKSGSVNVYVFSSGRIIQSASSTGEYVIASASGMVE